MGLGLPVGYVGPTTGDGVIGGFVGYISSSVVGRGQSKLSQSGMFVGGVGSQLS